MADKVFGKLILRNKDGVEEVFTPLGGGGGTSNYEKLENKPKINGIELIGDKTNNELGIFSKVDYTYTEDEFTLDFLANEGPGKELTVEHKTGETLNGKDVYECVYDLGNNFGITGSSTTTTIPVAKVTSAGIPVADIEYMVYSSALITAVGTTSACQPLALWVDNSSALTYQSPTSWSASATRNVKLYMKYTKK